MKKLTQITFIALTLVMGLTTTAFAQKYGHVNSGNIIAQMAESKSADAALVSFRDQLIKDGETMAAAVQKEYQDFAMEYQKGGVPPIEAQKKEAYFQGKQQEIAQYEQNMRVQLETKREELFTPILTRVQNEIDALAKEGGFTMVFDTSILVGNPILYAEDSVDLTDQVLARLK